jgi:hypothetical protein
MKGVIFTEFLEMVEQRYSPQVLERMIAAARLPSGAAYTAVGTYDHGEMWSLVIALSKVVDVSVPDLFRGYGEYLFGRLAVSYSKLMNGARSTFDLLENLDNMIHREVRRLYPDAELPRFDVVERTPTRMVVIYASKRHFADLAEGLLRASSRHFGQTMNLTRENLSDGDGSRVRFTLVLE